MSYWAFVSVTQPTFDSGLVAVPAVLTAVTAASPFGLISVLVVNPTAGPIDYTLTNTAGVPIIPTVEVPPGMDLLRVYVSLKCVGLKAGASALGLYHQISGLS